jgi:hypothetical protein
MLIVEFNVVFFEGCTNLNEIKSSEECQTLSNLPWQTATALLV